MLSITVSFNLNKCFPFWANESHSKYERSREVEREFVIITVQKRTTNKQTYS